MVSLDCLVEKVKGAFPDVMVEVIPIPDKREELVLTDDQVNKAKQDHLDHQDMKDQEDKWAKWVQEVV